MAIYRLLQDSAFGPQEIDRLAAAYEMRCAFFALQTGRTLLPK
jgi:hypothetical protein